MFDPRLCACVMRALALGTLLLAAAPARAEDDVAFALNWIISGRNAGYFVALDKGFYKDSGIKATITRGRGSGDTLKRVAIGESQYGLVDKPATVMSGRANDDVPVKMIGMMFGKSSTAILYARESGIKTPKDLEGRAVARSAAGATINMWPAFLTANHLDRSKIREITVTRELLRADVAVAPGRCGARPELLPRALPEGRQRDEADRRHVPLLRLRLRPLRRRDRRHRGDAQGQARSDQALPWPRP